MQHSKLSTTDPSTSTRLPRTTREVGLCMKACSLQYLNCTLFCECEEGHDLDCACLSCLDDLGDVDPMTTTTQSTPPDLSDVLCRPCTADIRLCHGPCSIESPECRYFCDLGLPDGHDTAPPYLDCACQPFVYTPGAAASGVEYCAEGWMIFCIE